MVVATQGPQPLQTPDVPFASLPISELAQGARRLEGETYLTGGYAIRRWIETSGIPFARVRDLARTWQPSRLKGITVSREHGEPFFTATQVFDIRPAARKWLAPGRTTQVSDRYVQPGWILMTCSGSVGDVILSYAPHAGAIISHDLLRVQPYDQQNVGFLYAFLRGQFGRAMLRSSRYGNIIKHLEPEHLDDVPVPLVDKDIVRMLASRVAKVFRLRDESFRMLEDAEAMFVTALGAALPSVQNSTGYSVSSREMFLHRRRIDGFHYNPVATAALRALQASGKRIQALSECVDRVFGVPRFKHVYADLALADHVGHDKRGNVMYVRDAEGNEVVETRKERIREVHNGVPVYREIQTSVKAVDDTTPRIAELYQAWSREQE